MNELVIARPVYTGLRVTELAHEALIAAGNRVEEQSVIFGLEFYQVTLRRPPTGIVPCLIEDSRWSGEPYRGLRMDNEPPYPREWPKAISCWDWADWVPCPRCGDALVWYEAGYVPGYRICTRGHHAQLANDGRTAKDMNRRTKCAGEDHE